MAHLLGVDRAKLLAISDVVLDKKQEFDALIDRRKRGEPYAYIVGRASFYDIELRVTPAVLIPRPETELLVDKALKVIQKEGIKHIVEVGVGSGAVSIMLARKEPSLSITATDISKEALKVAGENITAYNLQDRITLYHADLLEGIDESVAMVVSNPPYIANSAVLPKDVKAYEPKEALFGGKRGDEILQALIGEVVKRKIRYLACEMGYDQKVLLQTALHNAGAKEVRFYKDYAKLDRGFVARF